MAIKAAELQVVIGADDKPALDILGSFSTRFSGSLAGLSAVGGQIVTAGLTAAATGTIALGAGLAWNVKQATDAEAVQAQLNAVLQSTNGIAGVTAEQVNAIADEMSRLTPFEDEAIVGAESLLLTFTNIGKDIFPDATKVVADMSQALGQDLQSSAIQLGKALQDPIEGVTALRRVGVNFNDTQMDIIKNLVETGKVEEAQKIILEELRTEFGGSAEAAGQTLAGKLKILQTQLGNIGETIGGAVLPILSQLATQLLDYLARPEVQAGIAAIAQGLADFAARVASALPSVIAWFQQAFGWLSENEGVIVGVLAAIGVAIAAFVYTTVIPAAIAVISAMAPIIGIMAAVGAVAYLVYEAWTNNWGGIRDTLTAAWASIQPYLQQAWTWLQTNIPVALQTMKQIWDNIWNSIQAIVAAVMPSIQGIISAFQAAMSGNWYQFGASLRQVWDNNWKIIGNILSSAINNIVNTAKSLINRIITTFKTTNWLQVGKAIIDGLIKGLNNGKQAVINAIIAIGKAAIEAIKGFLGISSPSKVFEIEIGGNMMTGWVRGINDAIPRLRAAVENAGNIALNAAIMPVAPTTAQYAAAPAAASGNMTFYAPVTFRVNDERSMRDIMRSMRR